MEEELGWFDPSVIATYSKMKMKIRFIIQLNFVAKILKTNVSKVFPLWVCHYEHHLFKLTQSTE